jgi:hypothetical protein
MLNLIIKRTLLITLVLTTLFLIYEDSKHRTKSFPQIYPDALTVIPGVYNSVPIVYDINADGYEDLLLATTNDKLTPIEILINQKDGTFKKETSKYFKETPSAYYPVIRTGEFNNDGIKDFVIYDSGPGEGREDNGGGFIGATPTMMLSSNDGKWHKSTILSDAALEINTKCSNHCLIQNTMHVKDLTIADIDQDGDDDIYLESGGGYRQIYSHFLINENGHLTPHIDLPYLDPRILGGPDPNDTWRWVSVKLEDVNNDKYPDLILGRLARPNNHQDTMRNAVVINDKKGHFLFENFIELPQPQWNNNWTYVRRIEVEDIDGNGFPELLLTHEKSPDINGRHLQYLSNIDGKNFVDETDLRIPNQQISETSTCYGYRENLATPSILDFSDIDNDGDLDIVTIGQNTDVTECSPMLYINNGENIFEIKDQSELIVSPEKLRSTAVAHIDINKDGKIDFLFLATLKCSGGIFEGEDEETCLTTMYTTDHYFFSNTK